MMKGRIGKGEEGWRNMEKEGRYKRKGKRKMRERQKEEKGDG